MSKTEMLEQAVKALLSGENKGLNAEEFNTLVNNAESQTEIELYAEIYNYLLGQKHEEVMKDGLY